MELVVGASEEEVDPLVVVQLVEEEVSEEEVDPLVVVQLVEDEVSEEELVADVESVELDPLVVAPADEVLDELLLDAEDVGLLVDVTEVLDALVLLWLVEVGETVELDWLEVGSDGEPVPQ